MQRAVIACFLFIELLFVSAANAETVYQKNGIRLSIPKRWSVTEEEIDAQTHYLVIEKKGLTSTGMVTILAFETSPDLVDLISGSIESMQEVFSLLTLSGIDFSQPRPAKYGRYHGLVSTATFSVIGVKHQASIYAFEFGSKGLSLTTSEAILDRKVNLSGFQEIEKTLESYTK